MEIKNQPLVRFERITWGAERRLPSRVHRQLSAELRKAAFPKAKANKAFVPASGPATPAEGRVRLETAHQKFAEACRETASHRELMRTPGLGAVRVEDWVRFMELHTRHHGKQMADRWQQEPDGVRRAARESHPPRGRHRNDITERKMFGGSPSSSRSDVLRHRRSYRDLKALVLGLVPKMSAFAARPMRGRGRWTPPA